MGEIFAQLIELVNIGVAVFAVFAGVCLIMLAAAIVLHLLGVRAAERRPVRAPRAQRLTRARQSAGSQRVAS